VSVSLFLPMVKKDVALDLIYNYNDLRTFFIEQGSGIKSDEKYTLVHCEKWIVLQIVITVKRNWFRDIEYTVSYMIDLD
jgi:hypothetical protein